MGELNQCKLWILREMPGDVWAQPCHRANPVNPVKSVQVHHLISLENIIMSKACCNFTKQQIWQISVMLTAGTKVKAAHLIRCPEGRRGTFCSFVHLLHVLSAKSNYQKYKASNLPHLVEVRSKARILPFLHMIVHYSKHIIIVCSKQCLYYLCGCSTLMTLSTYDPLNEEQMMDRWIKPSYNRMHDRTEKYVQTY